MNKLKNHIMVLKILLIFLVELIYYIFLCSLFKIFQKKTNNNGIEILFISVEKSNGIKLRDNIILENLINDLNLKHFFFFQDKYKYFRNIKIINKVIKLNPKSIFFLSDYQKKYDNSLALFLSIKLIFKTRIISNSSDAEWSINYFRVKLAKKLFDFVLFSPFYYSKKNKKIKKFVELGMSNNNYFYNPNRERKIDVSFIGRVKNMPDRLEYLNYFEKNNLNINKYGIDFNKYLTYEDYQNILIQSKIVINFSKATKGASTKYQIKGRIYEAISSGALLLDQKNKWTNLFFRENIDYISFKSKEEALIKIKDILLNYDKYINITLSAQKKLANYSSHKMMANILKN